jgi:transposase
MLADDVDHVIGTDTHKHTHTAASVESKTGAPAPPLTATADPDGYRQLLDYADRNAPGRRAWAIESTGHYGAGLTAFLHERGELVFEVDRPKRPARRDGAKSDELDAVRAAREVLAKEHQTLPRRRGERAGLQIVLRTRGGAVDARSDAIRALRSAVVVAPESVAAPLRRLGGAELIRRCASLRIAAGTEVETELTKLSLRSLARRIQCLSAEIDRHEREILRLVVALCRPLLDQQGVGPVTAGELIVGLSHKGRLRSEAAFASLAGVAPIPASSGKTVRFRLNRGGDRRLNQALTTIVNSRMRYDAVTQDYVERRLAEGKSRREIRRCLKRYLARSLFRLMEAEMSY